MARRILNMVLCSIAMCIADSILAYTYANRASIVKDLGFDNVMYSLTCLSFLASWGSMVILSTTLQEWCSKEKTSVFETEARDRVYTILLTSAIPTLVKLAVLGCIAKDAAQCLILVLVVETITLITSSLALKKLGERMQEIRREEVRGNFSTKYPEELFRYRRISDSISQIKLFWRTIFLIWIIKEYGLGAFFALQTVLLACGQLDRYIAPVMEVFSNLRVRKE